MSRNAATLEGPSPGAGLPGAKVRCAANKAYASAIAVPPGPDGKPRLKVIHRTNDPETLRVRGVREARRLSRPVLVFRLRDGLYVGSYLPDGTTSSGVS